MTLVIPTYYTEHSRKNCSIGSSYSTVVSNRGSGMPCGFDGEPLDFETVSASFDSNVWSSIDDISNDFRSNSGSGHASGAPPAASPSAAKRKNLDDEEIHERESATKRSRSADECTVSSTTSDAAADEDNMEDDSSSDSSNGGLECGDHPSDGSMDDLFYTPRRKGPLLWSPRLRWKDERRKVLKISMAKIRRIDDPETFLRRSVLINNTVKRLQREMHEEKHSRYHHHHHHSYAGTGYHQLHDTGNTRAWGFESQPEDGFPKKHHPQQQPKISDDGPNTTTTVTLQTSCDEIFGVTEDSLRINIPVTASSVVTSTSSVTSTTKTVSEQGSSEQLAPVATPSSPERGNLELQRQTLPTQGESAAPCTCKTNSCSHVKRTESPRQFSQPSSPPPHHHTHHHHHHQCAVQYRTGPHDLGSDAGQGVSILDSVVYHSLLASLES